MIDEDFHMPMEFPVALRISGVLVNSPRHQQLDDIMKVFEPYLKEVYAYNRRRKLHDDGFVFQEQNDGSHGFTFLLEDRR